MKLAALAVHDTIKITFQQHYTDEEQVKLVGQVKEWDFCLQSSFEFCKTGLLCSLADSRYHL